MSAPATKKQKTEGKEEEVKTMSMDDFPVVELASFLKNGERNADCDKISDCLKEYGLLIIKDPRVHQEDQDTFLDMMEQYFEQDMEKKENDIHKEFSYQVGATPNGIEKARDHCSKVAQLSDDNQPSTLCPPEVDPKWRFFWRMGEPPKETAFKQLNAQPVLPPEFPQWADVMNKWGSLMLSAITTVAEMTALGYELPKDTFTKRMQHGPHLLAPTGSNFYKLGQKGTVMASYHYDLNFLTIHGRSRFPGLYVWTRDGVKMEVKVPPNCLLVQAGKQAEWLTGGEVLAGYHEVVVSERSVAAIERAKAAKRSLWRISSTLFGHIASDQDLQPLPKFATEETNKKYPKIKAGNQVSQELAAIKLGQGK